MCEEYDREDCCDGTSGSHFFFHCVFSFSFIYVAFSV